MPNRWASYCFFYKVDFCSENGYYIDTKHRRLYTTTPELKEFLAAIQVAQARGMQRIFKVIK